MAENEVEVEAKGRARARRRLNQVPEWKTRRVALAVNNLREKHGTTAALENTNKINPNWRMQSLSELVRGGGEHKTVMVFQIISIKSNKGGDPARTSQRIRGGRGGRVQDSNGTRYQRMITVMCVNSDSQCNIAVMFQGNGNNDNLFCCNLSERYSGGLRECRHGKSLSLLFDFFSCIGPFKALDVSLFC